MRLSTLTLIIALAHTSVAGYGQITLKEKNAPLEKILAAIEKQTKYVFLYDPDDVKDLTVTIDVKNATLKETLERCFKGLPIEFTVVGNNVLLKKKGSEIQNKAMTAEVTIQGRIFDENGQPLPGVTILNKKQRIGTLTDTGGAFSLSASKGDLLGFTFVGYKEKEISIGDQHRILLALEPNPSGPDMVVVIGYGSSKRKDLTGAVAIADVKNIDEVPFNTVDNALAGRAAGVEVTKSDGSPGGMSRVRVRGASSLLGGNDPLYVIDGIPLQIRSTFIDPGFNVGSPMAELAAGVQTGVEKGPGVRAPFVNGLNSLGGLNPDDIESINILKDASSTAIYGSKASNGVVIITTKTGTTNTPPRVAVNHYSTVTSLYRPPKRLNAAQYKMLVTEAARNAFISDSLSGFYVNDFIKTVLQSPSYFGTANTDWVKTVTHSTVATNTGISVSGGGQTSKYFTSVAYTNTPGAVKGSGYRRISGKLTLETQIRPKFKVNANLLLGFINQDISAGAYPQAVLARPDYSPRDPLGNYTDPDYQTGINSYAALNPVALTTATNNGRTLSILGSVSASYAIAEGLLLRSTVSLNKQDYNQRNYLPSYIALDPFYYNVPNPGGIACDANSRFTDWFLENTLSYNKKLDPANSFNAVIGQSYETTKSNFFRTTAAGFPNDITLTGLSSADTVLSVAGDDSRSPQSYLLSYYARINYSYQDKYLLTFTGRADGSSKFGPDNKYGYFPSGAIAWRISRENFLKNSSWINDLKLRGSYGRTGNQNIGDQLYRTLYLPSSYAGAVALVPGQFGNPGIKWENTRETDIGLDLSLLTGRLNATFDYYNRQTSGALLSQPVAASSGFVQVLQNAVGLRNRGFEATLGGDLVRNRDFRWSASLNVTWNTTLVTKLNPGADLQQIQSYTGLEVFGSAGEFMLAQGKPLGQMLGHYITGLTKTQKEIDDYTRQLGALANYTPRQQPGDPAYVLSTGQFLSVRRDVAIGSGPAKYYGGMRQDFSYKNFDLQCNFTFSHGGHLLWTEHAATTEFDGTFNANVSMLNRYTPENPTSNSPRLSLNNLNNPTNLDVFSSSYFKLRSLTLNYRLNNLQFFASATNVFTITKYPGSDPETTDDPYSIGGGYIDVSNYPAIRTFSLGIKALF